jgi:hypothetical protein
MRKQDSIGPIAAVLPGAMEKKPVICTDLCKGWINLLFLPVQSFDHGHAESNNGFVAT